MDNNLLIIGVQKVLKGSKIMNVSQADLDAIAEYYNPQDTDEAKKYFHETATIINPFLPGMFWLFLGTPENKAKLLAYLAEALMEGRLIANPEAQD